jgi:hypothetical protein
MKRLLLFIIWLSIGLLPSLLAAKEYKDQVVSDPRPGTPEHAVLKTIEACAADDFAGWWGAWCHPDLCIDTPDGKSNMQKYTWARCKKFAESYFTDKSRKSFKVAYTKPADVKDDATEVKFFLVSSKRDNPTPIAVKKHQGKWLVHSNSL